MGESERIDEERLAYEQAIIYSKELRALYDEEKQRREELEHARQKLKTIIENIPLGIINVTPDNIIEEYNSAFLEILELEKFSLPLSLEELLEKIKDVYRPVIELMLKKDTSSEHNLEFSVYGLYKQIRLQKNVIYDKKGVIKEKIFIIDEISKIVRASELRTWTEIARKIAHEIKNPLLPIQLSAERLLRLKNRPDRLLEVLPEVAENIINSAKIINNLITDFSSFAKLSQLNLVKENICKVIKESFDLFSASERVKWEIKCTQPIILTIDPLRMKEVFMNLIKNSIEAKPEGEVVIKIELESGDNSVTIHYRDNGPGIPDEVAIKLFKPYFTTKTYGTGLGLSIVYKIIDLHDGSITVDTKEKGAHFIIKLPRKRHV